MRRTKKMPAIALFLLSVFFCGEGHAFISTIGQSVPYRLLQASKDICGKSEPCKKFVGKMATEPAKYEYNIYLYVNTEENSVTSFEVISRKIVLDPSQEEALLSTYELVYVFSMIDAEVFFPLLAVENVYRSGRAIFDRAKDVYKRYTAKLNEGMSELLQEKGIAWRRTKTISDARGQLRRISANSNDESLDILNKVWKKSNRSSLRFAFTGPNDLGSIGSNLQDSVASVSPQGSQAKMRVPLRKTGANPRAAVSSISRAALVGMVMGAMTDIIGVANGGITIHEGVQENDKYMIASGSLDVVMSAATLVTALIVSISAIAGPILMAFGLLLIPLQMGLASQSNTLKVLRQFAKYANSEEVKKMIEEMRQHKSYDSIWAPVTIAGQAKFYSKLRTDGYSRNGVQTLLDRWRQDKNKAAGTYPYSNEDDFVEMLEYAHTTPGKEYRSSGSRTDMSRNTHGDDDGSGRNESYNGSTFYPLAEGLSDGKTSGIMFMGGSGCEMIDGTNSADFLDPGTWEEEHSYSECRRTYWTSDIQDHLFGHGGPDVLMLREGTRELRNYYYSYDENPQRDDVDMKDQHHVTIDGGTGVDILVTQPVQDITRFIEAKPLSELEDAGYTFITNTNAVHANLLSGQVYVRSNSFRRRYTVNKGSYFVRVTSKGKITDFQHWDGSNTDARENAWKGFRNAISYSLNGPANLIIRCKTGYRCNAKVSRTRRINSGLYEHSVSGWVESSLQENEPWPEAPNTAVGQHTSLGESRDKWGWDWRTHIRGIENVAGTHYSDKLEGSSGNNKIYSNGGNDIIYGHAGDDEIYAVPGRSKIWGGSGSDYIFANVGTIRPEDGDDVVEATGRKKEEVGIPAMLDVFGSSGNDSYVLSGLLFANLRGGDAGRDALILKGDLVAGYAIEQGDELGLVKFHKTVARKKHTTLTFRREHADELTMNFDEMACFDAIPHDYRYDMADSYCDGVDMTAASDEMLLSGLKELLSFGDEQHAANFYIRERGKKHWYASTQPQTHYAFTSQDESAVAEPKSSFSGRAYDLSLADSWAPEGDAIIGLVDVSVTPKEPPAYSRIDRGVGRQFGKDYLPLVKRRVPEDQSLMTPKSADYLVVQGKLDAKNFFALWSDMPKTQVFSLRGGMKDDLFLIDGNAIVEVFAGAGNDRLAAMWDSKYAVRFHGGDGDDNLHGTLFDDHLYGGSGGDVIRGLKGADVITGGAGVNRLYGGAGNDHYEIAPNSISLLRDFDGDQTIGCTKEMELQYETIEAQAPVRSSDGEIILERWHVLKDDDQKVYIFLPFVSAEESDQAEDPTERSFSISPKCFALSNVGGEVLQQSNMYIDSKDVVRIEGPTWTGESWEKIRQEYARRVQEEHGSEPEAYYYLGILQDVVEGYGFYLPELVLEETIQEYARRVQEYKERRVAFAYEKKSKTISKNPKDRNPTERKQKVTQEKDFPQEIPPLEEPLRPEFIEVLEAVLGFDREIKVVDVDWWPREIKEIVAEDTEPEDRGVIRMAGKKPGADVEDTVDEDVADMENPLGQENNVEVSFDSDKTAPKSSMKQDLPEAKLATNAGIVVEVTVDSSPILVAYQAVVDMAQLLSNEINITYKTVYPNQGYFERPRISFYKIHPTGSEELLTHSSFPRRGHFGNAEQKPLLVSRLPLMDADYKVLVEIQRTVDGSEEKAYEKALFFSTRYQPSQKVTQYCARYRERPDGRYLISDDRKVIMDQRTQLSWQRCPLGLSGEDCRVGEAVSSVYPAQNRRPMEVRLEQLLEQFNAPTSDNSGYSDWRMPSYKELLSTQDLLCSPAVNLSAFPDAERYIYWPATGRDKAMPSTPILRVGDWKNYLARSEYHDSDRLELVPFVDYRQSDQTLSMRAGAQYQLRFVRDAR